MLIGASLGERPDNHRSNNSVKIVLIVSTIFTRLDSGEAIKAPTMYPLESAASIPGYVHLKWTHVPEAEGYEVFSTKTLETLFTNIPLSVFPSSSSKTAVTELPAGATEAYVPASSTEKLWYAGRTVIGGHLELKSSRCVGLGAGFDRARGLFGEPGVGNGGWWDSEYTIKGTGFVAGASVKILQPGKGATAIPASNVVVVSPTEITAVTGGPGQPGTWNLIVTDTGGVSTANNAGDDYLCRRYRFFGESGVRMVERGDADQDHRYGFRCRRDCGDQVRAVASGRRRSRRLKWKPHARDRTTTPRAG